MKYIRRPVEPDEIDAVQLTNEIPGIASEGSWLCVGASGQFFMSDEEFEETYMPKPEKINLVSGITGSQVTRPKPQKPDAKFLPGGYNPREGLMTDDIYNKIT